MCDPELVSNARQGPGHMAVHCTTVVARTSSVGDFPGFDQDNTWLYPNALPIALVHKRYHVTYDSALKGDTSFVVYLVKYRTIQFFKSDQGLYY